MTLLMCLHRIACTSDGIALSRYVLIRFAFVLFCYDLVACPCMLQDHIVPYMLDTRHIRDTLFIVLEEDFRLYPTEGEHVASDVPISRGEEFLGGISSGDGTGREPDASPNDVKHQVVTARAQWQARLGVPTDGRKVIPGLTPTGKAAPAPTFLTRPTKASAYEHRYNTSRELED